MRKFPAVEAQFSRQKKVRFRYHLGKEFTGFEVAAMWGDTTSGRVRVFHDSELADVRRWVGE